MNRLIITADDYGMCDAVNEAIEECLAAGNVRATCVMMNMPAYTTAVHLRNRFPQTSIGIHWTLTQGRPVLSPMKVPSLIHTDGEFHSALRFRSRWLMRRITPAEIKAELQAQYQRFFEVAGAPDFWNTHENVHVLPGLFEVCVALGRELCIPAMRCHRRFTVPRDTFPTRYHLLHPMYWLKGRVIARWSRLAESQGVLMPNGRLHMPGYETGIAAIEEVVKRLQGVAMRKTVEMVIHPASVVQEELFGGLTEKRILEYKLYRDPGLAQRLQQCGVESVGFEVLHESY